MGFSEGKNTTAAIANLTQRILKGWENKNIDAVSILTSYSNCLFVVQMKV